MCAVIVTVRGIRPQETKSRGLRTDMTDKWRCYMTDRHVTCHTSVTTASVDQSWLTTCYLFHWFAGWLRRRLVLNSCLQSCRADQIPSVLMTWGGVSACNMLGPYTHTQPTQSHAPIKALQNFSLSTIYITSVRDDMVHSSRRPRPPLAPFSIQNVTCL